MKAEGRKRGSETRGFPVRGAGGPDSPQLCWTPGRVWERLSLGHEGVGAAPVGAVGLALRW